MPYNLETVEDLTSPGKVLSYRQTIEDKIRPAVRDANKEFLKQARALVRSEGNHIRQGQFDNRWEDIVRKRMEHTNLPTELRPRVTVRLLDSSLPETVYDAAKELLSASNEEHWSKSDLDNVIDAQLGFHDLSESVQAASLLNKLSERYGEWAAQAGRMATNFATDLAANSVSELMKTERNPRRKWVTRRDAKVRETHSVADGQVRGANETFVVGGYELMTPGDPGAPPSEVKNCRCVVVLTMKQGAHPSKGKKLPSVMFNREEQDLTADEIEEDLLS